MSIRKTVNVAISQVTRSYADVYEVHSYAESSLSSTTGLWTPGAVTVKYIGADIQPTPGSMLKVLPTGFVIESSKMVFTNEVLKKETDNRLADKFILADGVYSVVHAEEWGGRTEAVISKDGV